MDYQILYISSWLSLLCCFAASIIMFLNLVDITNYAAFARITKEIVLYSQEPTFVLHQRFMQQGYTDTNCEAFSPQYLQPNWKNNDDVPFAGVASVTTVYAKAQVNLWHVVFFIYLFAAGFQFTRAIQYRLDIYHMEKGPDFSRWLEYFCTSPLQILIVYLSFGFGNLDILLGAMGMQAALVLLGYDIEQQIKKKIKRRVKNDNPDPNPAPKAELDEDPPNKRQEVFHHQFWIRYVHASTTSKAELDEDPPNKRQEVFHHQFPIFNDIRIVVYLLFAWILHLLIWGIPYLESNTNWGVGGRLAIQKLYSNQCHKNNHDKEFNMPEIVDIIFSAQYWCFTLFGLVSTSQVVYVWMYSVNRIQFTQEVADMCWTYASLAYTVLSMTAKLALEAGFLVLATQWNKNMHWKELPVLPSCDGPFTFSEGQCISAANFTA
jgi:hypothetical protein